MLVLLALMSKRRMLLINSLEKKIQVNQSDWERVKAQHMVLRLTYDPLVGGSVLPARGVVGQPVVIWRPPYAAASALPVNPL